MRTHGSVAAVVAAIQDDLQIEIERLEAETAEEMARLERDFERRPPTIPDRDTQLAIARAQARERLGREDYKDAHADIETREAWMRKVVAEGHRRLAAASPACRRQVLGRLADEALSRIPARECVLQIGRQDLGLADEEWVNARVRNTAKAAVNVVGIELAGGCIAVSSDGRVAFDNGIAARAERLEPQWRSALAALFNEARR